MHIDRKELRLVIEISRGEDAPVIVHSEAITTATFEQYFDLLGQTMNGLTVYGQFAPRYAALVFKQVAMRPLVFEEDGTEKHTRIKAALEARVNGFYNELHRLTSVLALKDGRWDMLPIDDAKNIGAISAEEVSRIDAAATFFICASQSVPLEDVEAILGGLSLFHAQIVSLSCTEFASSLPTSTKGGNSGVSAASSPTSSPGRHQTSASAPSSNGSTSPNSHGAHRQLSGIAFSLPK